MEFGINGVLIGLDKTKDKKIPLFVLVGPTATGKTEIAVILAQHWHGEVVSADSMLVYKSMDIGTAKPSLQERQGIVHHMIDVVEPEEEFTVARYMGMAKQAIEEIAHRGKLPMLVGGTGLYIQSIIETVNFGLAKPDGQIREALMHLIEEKGKEYVHTMLQQVDPVTACRLHPNDVKRVVRALEVYQKTGKPMSQMIMHHEDSPYDLYVFGLTMDRQKLYTKINQRVDKMIQEGLVEEVKHLWESGCHEEFTSMQGLGYKEMLAYIKGEISFLEAVEKLKQGTRRLAKRQLTWFKRDKRIQWIVVDHYQNAGEVAQKIIDLAAGIPRPVSKPFNGL